MSYQETTTNSYGSRLGGSLKGIGGGFVAIILGTILLWWNEGRAVKNLDMLKEAQSKAVCIDNVDIVDPDYDGKLIHAIGRTATTDSLSDPIFGIGAISVKLDRKVEYYQWVEGVTEVKKDKLGGSEVVKKTYTYKKQWVDKPVNSSDFKDSSYQNANKVLMSLDDESQVAENVTFGAYRLPAFLISSIDGDRPLNAEIPAEVLSKINDKLTTAPADTMAGAGNDYEMVHQSGNTLYIGRSEAAPEVGDMKVTFTHVLPDTVSLIARVKGDTFTNYVAKNGKKFAVLSNGERSLEEMMESAKSSNKLWLWVFRVIGVLIVVGGFKALFAPIPTLLKIVPFLSNIIGAGVNFVATVLGIVWSLVVIALAWIFYRPVLAVILLLVAAAGVYMIVKRNKNKKDK